MFTIYEFKNRKNPKGVRHTLSWDELVDKMAHPVYTDETFEEYQRMSNEQKTDVKDVGGYIAGDLEGGKRGKATCKNRCIATIDADNAKADDWANFSALYPYAACCHSTHSSTKENPRLRWLFPLSRPVTADEYRVVVNELAKMVGADTVDESTDQPERLMFLPSVSFDADYAFNSQAGEAFDVDACLSEAGYEEPEKPMRVERPLTEGTLSIAEGQRNKAAFTFASMLRGNGLDASGIREMLEGYNDRYCVPPLPPEELDTICRSVCTRYNAGEAIAGSLRDAWDDFNDMGERGEREPKDAPQKRIAAESMANLAQRHIEAPTYVVDNLIANGITILASPPKFGKSWMCMDLAISVATGTRFMGLETKQRGVVYFALEDGDYRLQERSFKVAGDRQAPENLYFVKEAPGLTENLLPQLKEFIGSLSDVGMIIIDTLQKIRGTAGKTEGVYGYDYRELGQLHKFALENNLALVLVHHLNKGGDDSDFVGRLNGSTGISGAADSIITLSRARRGDKETKMCITGRDVVERTLILQMDWSLYRWIILGEEHEVEATRDELDFGNNPLVKTVVRTLDELDDLNDEDETVWECTSAELIAECERLFGPQKLAVREVGRAIFRLEEQLVKYEGIEHTYDRQGKDRRRVHRFSREKL